MKKYLLSLMLAASFVTADTIPPQPLTIDIQLQKAPDASAFRANDKVYRFTLQNGGASYDASDATISGSWFTNVYSSQVMTGTVTKVDGGSNGVFDLSFEAASLNFDPGNYKYGITILDSAGSLVTWNQGNFEIKPSPPITGVGTNGFTSTINWALYDYQNTTTDGPVRPGTGLTSITNADGSITISANGQANTVSAGDGTIAVTSGVDTAISVDATVFRADGSVRATGDFNMGTNSIKEIEAVKFVPNGSAIEVYGMGFDENANTMAVRIGTFTNSLLNIGEEMWIQSKASDGSTYGDGTNVYFVSASGDKPTVGIMDGTDIDKLKLDAGTVTADASGSDLLTAPFGVLNDQNTSAYSAGDLLALDSAGGWTTNTMGTVPHIAAIVLRSHANSGKILRFPARILWNLDLITDNGAVTDNAIEVGGLDISNTGAYNVFATNANGGLKVAVETDGTVRVGQASGSTPRISYFTTDLMLLDSDDLWFNGSQFTPTANGAGSIGETGTRWGNGWFDDIDVTATVTAEQLTSTDDIQGASLTLTGTTNVTQTVLTLNGTNYISWVLEGSSITNLMPLVYE